MKSSGCTFDQRLVNQTPVYDKRRKHTKPAAKHSGNVAKKVKFLK